MDWCLLIYKWTSRILLLEYRRKKIEPIMKDIQRSILSDQLLEEFVRRKPTTKKEFFEFPLALRDQIEPGQGRLRDEILDIVEEFST